MPLCLGIPVFCHRFGLLLESLVRRLQLQFVELFLRLVRVVGRDETDWEGSRSCSAPRSLHPLFFYGANLAEIDSRPIPRPVWPPCVGGAACVRGATG